MKIWIVGDSTAADKLEQERPQTGWGEKLAEIMADNVQVVNLAKNGASTQSFLMSNRWGQLQTNLQAGDYVLIQFGHNDQKIQEVDYFSAPWDRYQHNLLTIIDVVQNKRATPILLTSITRRIFSHDNQMVDTFGDYLIVVRQIAAVKQIDLIDMHLLSQQAIQPMGPVASKKIYMHYAPGEMAHYPQGVRDNTHFSPEGARLMATLLVEQIKQQKLIDHLDS